MLSNSFNQTLGYRVDGPTATFLGEGEQVNSFCDDVGITADVGQFVADRAGPQTRAYTTVPLNREYGRYHLRVCPSKESEAPFRTNSPILYTCLVALAFLLTSAVFVSYDLLVQRRQKVVLRTAVRSTKIVSSLFPETIRDRVYENAEENETTARNLTESWATGEPDKNLPIADLFPNTTILFADLKGFTAWSSERQPVEVFKLLETLYGAFDEIAIKRSVFKVETIGDCYVAATGLPEPQPDHAVRMVKFAQSCMDKMPELLLALTPTLGDETADLQMRVGMHSGPVTAGVLRGRRSRFQLFGDSVNYGTFLYAIQNR